MRKAISLLMAAVLVLSLFGCASNENGIASATIEEKTNTLAITMETQPIVEFPTLPYETGSGYGDSATIRNLEVYFDIFIKVTFYNNSVPAPNLYSVSVYLDFYDENDNFIEQAHSYEHIGGWKNGELLIMIPNKLTHKSFKVIINEKSTVKYLGR